MEEFETTAREIEPVQREPLEFIVNDDFIKRLPQIISNIDEIKAEITERTETDRNLVLTTQEDFDHHRGHCRYRQSESLPDTRTSPVTTAWGVELLSRLSPGPRWFIAG